MNNVLYMAEQVGNEFRGLVVDAKSYKTVSRTRHNYMTETIARCAARREWEEGMSDETCMPYLTAEH